jgi:hypothetical protein
MTVVADDKRRVTLPTKPGERFDVQTLGDEKFILTRLAPVATRPAKVTFKKVDGYTVGELGHPINEAALKEALAEFP